MIIAREKRKTNIAEYVIYMWHIEDLVRACNLRLEMLNDNIISKFEVDAPLRKDIEGWYESIIDMMRNENIALAGHLQLVKNAVLQMDEVHHLLLKAHDQHEYMRYFFAAKPNISLFRNKSNNAEASDVEICLQALYSQLLMKLSGKPLNDETADSMETFSNLMALLSSKFKATEEGELDLYKPA